MTFDWCSCDASLASWRSLVVWQRLGKIYLLGVSHLFSDAVATGKCYYWSGISTYQRKKLLISFCNYFTKIVLFVKAGFPFGRIYLKLIRILIKNWIERNFSVVAFSFGFYDSTNIHLLFFLSLSLSPRVSRLPELLLTPLCCHQTSGAIKSIFLGGWWCWCGEQGVESSLLLLGSREWKECRLSFLSPRNLWNGSKRHAKSGRNFTFPPWRFERLQLHFSLQSPQHDCRSSFPPPKNNKLFIMLASHTKVTLLAPVSHHHCTY